MRQQVLVTAFLLAAGIDASAQEFTGSIYGRIVDPANALMPGVSITVEGEAIQGQRTAESEANGSYRFLNLPQMKVLNRFAEASGGRAWEIAEAAFGKNMDAVLDTIAAELRSQYRIGYYPNRPAKDGKWHSVRIRMKNPDYLARARKEYLDK